MPMALSFKISAVLTGILHFIGFVVEITGKVMTGIGGTGTVWAGYDTVAATDAFLIINNDQAVIALIGSRNRANRCTGR